MTRPADAWGPFSGDLDAAERAARCRALAALARVYIGPKADALVLTLRRLERDPGAAGEALALLDTLPALARRRALASYAALHRCAPSSARHERR